MWWFYWCQLIINIHNTTGINFLVSAVVFLVLACGISQCWDRLIPVCLFICLWMYSMNFVLLFGMTLFFFWGWWVGAQEVIVCIIWFILHHRLLPNITDWGISWSEHWTSSHSGRYHLGSTGEWMSFVCSVTAASCCYVCSQTCYLVGACKLSSLKGMVYGFMADSVALLVHNKPFK